MRVAIRGLHLNHAFAHFQNRNIERAAAEVIHRDGLVLAFIQPVSQGRRRRLIDNALYIQPGNLARVLGRLALRVIEVRRNRDDGFRHLLAQVIFRGLL